MALSPVKATTFALLWVFWVSLMTGADSQNQDIPDCTGWDVLTGCDGTTDALYATMAIGTIPNADPDVNAFFAIIGLIARITGIWGLMELIRGT